MINQFIMLSIVILLCGVVSIVSADCHNGIITGEWTTNDGLGPSYILGGGPKVVVSGNEITLAYSSGAGIARVCQDHWSPDIFKVYHLMDKTISFTADVSSIGCGCNAAFYLTSSPAYNQSQVPDQGQCGDYYCDANKVCGQWCPEIDLFEANNRALQVTPHTCDAPQGKYYSKCDGGGCGRNTHKLDAASYGYGSNYTINTQNPFRVSITFKSSNNVFSSMTTVLTQGSKSFTMVHDAGVCGGSYLPNLTEAVNAGMTISISHWSGTSGATMEWLDVPPCDVNESCSQNGIAKYSDLVVQ